MAIKLRQIAYLVSLVASSAACGSENTDDGATGGTSGAGGTSGSSGASGSGGQNQAGTGGSSGTGGAAVGGSAGTGGSSGGTGGSPFDSTLVCRDDGNEWFRLVGMLGGETFTMENSDPSNIVRGRLNNAFDLIALEWEGSLTRGVAVPLTGDVIVVPEGHSLADQSVCITRGVFGAVPEAQQPTDGLLFRFRIDGVRGGADCAGAEIEAELEGCWFRTNMTLP